MGMTIWIAFRNNIALGFNFDFCFYKISDKHHYDLPKQHFPEKIELSAQLPGKFLVKRW
jgi:hypothetical protein